MERSFLEFLRHFQVLFLKIHIFFIVQTTTICHWINSKPNANCSPTTNACCARLTKDKYNTTRVPFCQNFCLFLF
jgi:hypothetical protein